jgi:hypothetical protein
MDMNGQIHVPASLPQGQNPPFTITGLRFALDFSEKRDASYVCRQWHHEEPVASVLALDSVPALDSAAKRDIACWLPDHESKN